MHGVVFHIQRFSLDDGPGVRTVVFLKGCPLRCLWCHNPEGLSPRPQIMFNAERCIACGACAEVCPSGWHRIEAGRHIFAPEGCGGCGQCAEVCCGGGLTLSGRAFTVEQVLEQVARDTSYYEASGGGLTLSGGEPLMQAAFAEALLARAKDMGLHTCVETCGMGTPEQLRGLARVTDLFLWDYKATGDDMHRALCGVPQTAILQNLALLEKLGAAVVLRCPIVPGCNDTEGHLSGIIDTARRFSCVREIHLEPYHRLGIAKAAQLGMRPAYEGAPPAREDMERLCADIAARTGKPTCIH